MEGWQDYDANPNSIPVSRILTDTSSLPVSLPFFITHFSGEINNVSCNRRYEQNIQTLLI
jgi:hypothetical protein